MKPRYYQNFQNGMFKSEYTQNGFYTLDNCDVYSKLGTCQSQRDFALDDVNKLCNESCILVMTTGGVLFAISTDSGKIWKRLSNGTWSLAHTNTNGANVGGGFYNNRLWYFTTTKLGYYDLASTWQDSHGTFANSTSTRPFLVGGVNTAFAYIGDVSQLARVDKDNNFSANVLDLPLGQAVTDIQEWGDDLVISTTGIVPKIYRWNQFGDTYYRPDLISFKDIDLLVQSQNSNITFAICRNKDNYVEIMYYTGAELSQVEEKIIRDTTDSNSYLGVEFDGKIHFCVGKKIYTIKNSALICEYTLPYDIKGITSNGTDLFVSCGSNGVYKTTTNKANALIITPIIEGKPTKIFINYDLLPAGTSITLRVKADNGDWTTTTLNSEPENMRYTTNEGLPMEVINFIQLEITLNSSTIYSPIIRSIEVQ